jgi:hypothetical protein
MEDILGIIAVGLAIVGIVFAVMGIEGLIIWWAWNSLLAGALHLLPHITFMNAVAVAVLLDMALNSVAFLTGGFFRKSNG